MNFSNIKLAALLALLVPVFCFGKLPQSFYANQAKVPTLRFLQHEAQEVVARINHLNNLVDALERTISDAEAADVALLAELFREKQDELIRALNQLQSIIRDEERRAELFKQGISVL